MNEAKSFSAEIASHKPSLKINFIIHNLYNDVFTNINFITLRDADYSLKQKSKLLPKTLLCRLVDIYLN